VGPNQKAKVGPNKSIEIRVFRTAQF